MVEVRRKVSTAVPENIEYSSVLDTYRKTLDFIDGKMESIEQISLEEEEYNELYLALRAARNAMLKVIRAQYEVDKKEEQNALWDDMRRLRSPSDDINI